MEVDYSMVLTYAIRPSAGNGCAWSNARPTILIYQLKIKAVGRLYLIGRLRDKIFCYHVIRSLGNRSLLGHSSLSIRLGLASISIK